MKRNNPKTGKPFKAREEENGRFFKSYDSSRTNKQGFFGEKWYGAMGERNLTKRINPETNRPFKRGDRDENGRVFKNYEFVGNKIGGYAKEKWYSEQSYFRNCVYNKYRDSLRNRNNKRQPGFETLKNNISTDYLISIFPKDKRCPVFGFQMVFDGHRDTSPSLDRINPKEGYTKENTIWISYLANRMKSNLSIDDLIKIKDWAKSNE
jgi:hypothetical protein